ncbi:baseplate J/gp47 family protein [Burkholderia vietnamiensis]|uniref:baseplate J/gp47 family protein n=1 Tax=Burkholderia vietnamiensis TaxID=60552 RepID=UPI000AA33C30|nr:baseplate J/gp47 family protein [Burkholderia vietnamiensis]
MKARSQPPSPNSKTSIDPAIERAVLKAKCERDHLFFSRYFFEHRQAIKFRVNWHHVLIADTVQRLIDGTLKNVVINVPPGSSKTELVAINLIARGLALNPRARFLHISYSDDLALLTSETARDIVSSDEYQALWPLKVADDAKSKKRWNVLVDGKKAGGVYAVSLGGQITGFRAGHMTDGWQGAIIIDDPLKVEDAYSKTNRDKANRKIQSTVKSRKANPDTPIIVIMQRLAEEDPTGFIKAGKLPGEWEFIEIPALITDDYVAKLPTHNVKINGIARKVASYSSADLVLIGQAGATITNGVAKDANGVQWLLPATVTIPPSGTITVTATCASIGEVSARAGTINQIATPALGWQSETDPADAAEGAPVEKDAVLRQRQTVSTALPSLTVLDGIIGAVANVPGVTRYVPYENDTDATDANGIPSHSISLVVEGGDATAIANAIAAKKTPGSGTYGTTAIIVADIYGRPTTIRFSGRWLRRSRRRSR